MNDQRSSENWELEEGGESDDRWLLQESEQRLTDQWQLEDSRQDDQQDDVGEWQPVEYQKQRRAGPTWILPSVITVALLGVIGYSAWVLAPRFIGGGTPTTPPSGTIVALTTETPISESSAVETTAVPGEEPQVVVSTDTATEEPSPVPPLPADTPSPTPPVVNQSFATVTSTYGVNARIAPSTDAEIIRILEQGETFFVLEQRDDGWLEVFATEPGTSLAPGQPINGRVGYAAAEYFAIAEQPLLEEFAVQILTEAGRAPTVEPTVTPVPEVEGTATPGLQLPTVTPLIEGQGITSTVQPTTTGTNSVTVIVDAVNGLNVRVQPSLNSDIVALLESGVRVPAISRYVDNQWVQVALEDGAVGWVFADFVELDGDLTSLPVTTFGELPAPTSTPTPSPTLTPEPVANAEPIEPPGPYTSTLPVDSPAVIVPSIAGVNARSAPSTEAEVIAIVPQNAALPARARSSDGQWVQVELPDGVLVWVFRDTVVATSDITSLPVVGDGSTTPPTPTVTSPTPSVESPATPDAVSPGETEQAGAVVTVRSIVLAVYPAPDSTLDGIEVVARGNELPALGRTTDGAWIQIQTKSGATGWVNAGAVALNVDLETLPVVQ